MNIQYTNINITDIHSNMIRISRVFNITDTPDKIDEKSSVRFD